MTYDEFIQSIINERGKHGCGEEYHERHHILPRCLGGADNDDNMIDLFASEHYIAHKLLALENPHENKLQYAWWMMSSVKNTKQERVGVSAEDYEKAKIAMATAKSRDMMGSNNFNYGRQASEETKKKISDNHRDCTGINNPMYGAHRYGEENPMYGVHRFGEANPFYGHHHTEDAKDKNRKAHLGRKPNEATRKKLSLSHKGKNGKPVLCLETGEVFNSVSEAEEKYNICKNSVGSCCRGRYKSAGGYHWKYVEEN